MNWLMFYSLTGPSDPTRAGDRRFPWASEIQNACERIGLERRLLTQATLCRLAWVSTPAYFCGAVSCTPSLVDRYSRCDMSEQTAFSFVPHFSLSCPETLVPPSSTQVFQQGTRLTRSCAGIILSDHPCVFSLDFLSKTIIINLCYSVKIDAEL